MLEIAKARHSTWLESLGADRDEAQIGRTYRRLRLIEVAMGRDNDSYANGDIDSEQHDKAMERAKRQVRCVFGELPKGFYLNSDPRGYALKIDLESIGVSRQNIYTDWGGYGLLAPSFEEYK